MYSKYIEPVLFLYALTFFFNIPMERQMVVTKVCLNRYNATFCASIAANPPNKTHKEENIIQAESAQWFIRLNVARILPSIVSTIFLGALSDGVGRKKIILLAVFGEALNAIGYFINAWHLSAPVGFLLIQCIVTGLCGNFPAILMSVLAYVGDFTTPDSRTDRIIFLDILIFLASLVAYLSGGIIAEKIGYQAIYVIDIGIYAIIFTYMLFLKESYEPTEGEKLKDVLQKVKGYVGVFNKQDGNRVKFTLVIGCLCGLFFITTGIDEVLIIYLLHTPLTFLPSSIGFVLASESSARFIGAVVVTLLFMRTFHWRDSSLMLLSAVALVGYSLSLAFSRVNWAIYASTLWNLGSGSGIAACRSFLSKMVSPEELGRLNSILSVLQFGCLILSSVIFNSIYTLTVHINPSITFYIVGGFCVVPVLLSVALKMTEIEDSGYDQISTTEVEGRRHRRLLSSKISSHLR